MLELAEKHMKGAVINIFRDLKEKMVWLSKQMRNLSRETETNKKANKKHMTVLEQKNTIWNEMKPSLDGLNIRLESLEDSKLEERSIEII